VVIEADPVRRIGDAVGDDMKKRVKLIRRTDTSLGRLQPGACPKLPELEANRLMSGTNPYAVEWTPPEPAKPKAEARPAEKKSGKKPKGDASKKPAKPDKTFKLDDPPEGKGK
jgi:hypothetical protein